MVVYLGYLFLFEVIIHLNFKPAYFFRKWLLFLPKRSILVVVTAYIIFYKFLMKHDIKKFFYPPDGLVNLFLVTYTYGVIISFDYIHFVSYKSAVFIIPIVYLIQLLFAFFISMVSHRIRKASVDKKPPRLCSFIPNNWRTVSAVSVSLSTITKIY